MTHLKITYTLLNLELYKWTSQLHVPAALISKKNSLSIT